MKHASFVILFIGLALIALNLGKPKNAPLTAYNGKTVQSIAVSSKGEVTTITFSDSTTLQLHSSK